MRGGTRVVADRFDVEAFAGSGGMGDVFRARDRLTGVRVALKLPRTPGHRERDRFLREAASLAELRHEAIVGYVAHGQDHAGELFLAMEWIGGEGLDAYLKHAHLSAGETVRLGRRLADAIASAHRRGIVHRDLKPSNVMLLDGDLERPKVLDFGLARFVDVTRGLTRTGVAVGTPAYMAPEQASADRQVDARADVFSLGCILFECLAGRPAFQGEQVAAILLKVLYDVPPRLRDLLPDVPAELDELVARMLAKSPSDRPASMAIVVEALDALGAQRAPSLPPRARPPRTSVTPAEQRLTSLVLVSPPPVEGDARLAATMALDSVASWLPLVREAAAKHGGAVEGLADGSAVVTLVVSDSASDLATRACRCALAIRRALPEAFVSVAMGRCELGSRPGASAMIERAARLLASTPPPPGEGEPPTPAASGTRRRAILLDPITAGLLDARFEAEPDPEGAQLFSERPFLEAPRALGAQASLFVGRERERATVRAVYEEVAAESVARVVLVTAPAGFGKTRLAFELGRDLATSDIPGLIIFARGFPTTAGAPFAMLRSMLASLAGYREGDSRAQRRSRLEARLAHGLDAAERGPVLDALATATGLEGRRLDSFHDLGRDEGQLLRDAVARAFVTLLRAETRVQPVVLCLEDLQWGDLSSLKLVDTALQRLAECPLFVLGVARPEVDRMFPDLFAERGLLEVRLGPLSPRASERLVAGLLGGTPAPELVRSIVASGQGNPYFLEELVRATARGDGEALPETLVAAVQARMERLAPEARRALRAASVFGLRFRASGVVALLGGDRADVVACLEELVSEGLLVLANESDPTRDHFAFTQPLVREAAYAMLTDEDRTFAHRQAAAWLGRAESASPIVLVGHLERAGLVAEAIPLHVAVAEDALLGSDGRAAVEHAERALALGAVDDLAAACWSVLLRTHLLHGDLQAAERAGKQIERVAKVGTALFCTTTFDRASIALVRGALDELDALARQLLDADPAEDARSVYVRCVAKLLVLVTVGGNRVAAERAKLRLDALGTGLVDPRVTGHVAQGRAHYAELVAADPWEQLQCSEQAAADLDRAREWQAAAFARAQALWARTVLGLPTAELAEHALTEASRHEVGIARGMLDAFAGLAEVLQRRPAEGRARIQRGFDATPMPFIRARLACVVARAALLDGDAEAAAAAVAHADGVVPTSVLQASTTIHLAAATLLAGRPDAALVHAERALAFLEAHGSVGHDEALLRVVLVDALVAQGRHERARDALAAAQERLLAFAERIPLAERGAYLAHLPEHQRLLSHPLAPRSPRGTSG